MGAAARLSYYVKVGNFLYNVNMFADTHLSLLEIIPSLLDPSGDFDG
jgi:hypothetical protein